MVDRDLGRIDQLIFLIVKPLSGDLLADLEILGDRHSLLFGLKNSIGPLGDLNPFLSLLASNILSEKAKKIPTFCADVCRDEIKEMKY